MYFLLFLTKGWEIFQTNKQIKQNVNYKYGEILPETEGLGMPQCQGEQVGTGSAIEELKPWWITQGGVEIKYPVLRITIIKGELYTLFIHNLVIMW